MGSFSTLLITFVSPLILIIFWRWQTLLRTDI